MISQSHAVIPNRWDIIASLISKRIVNRGMGLIQLGRSATGSQLRAGDGFGRHLTLRR
jgi:hypothetical protein